MEPVEPAGVAVQELEPFPKEKNALPMSGRGFYGKNRGPQDGATHIYTLEYINQCESHAFCHIPALNQLPWGILASLNRKLSKL